jgi:biofilm PGA synthesis N-glycosyltransferase PgaC
MIFPQLGPEDLSLLGITLFLWLIMAWYYLRWFTASGSRKRLKQEEQRPSGKEPVSVIICAHNELENLKKNLPLILAQQHHDFEVIVIDDGSWDGSAEFLRSAKNIYPNLKICTVDRDRVRNPGKKLALTIGIKAAAHDLLLFTDADCEPDSIHWLSRAAAGFTSGIALVLGFSPYKKHPGFLNLFIRFETLISGMQYLSMALHGKSYMGVGRNMAYRKDLFFRVKGFASHHHLPAGDDDLFVQDAANASNTAVILHPEAHVTSEPKLRLKDWWKQKKRHLFVGKHYKPSVKRFLGLLSFSQLAFYLTLIAWFIWTAYWWLPLMVYAIWLLLRFVVVARTASLLQQMQILWAYPLLDICYVFFLTIAGLNAWFAKRIHW